MIIIPIRTESATRRTPTMNYALIAANLLAYLLFKARFGDWLPREAMLFDSSDPRLTQFISYQFLHDGLQHLFGNLLFLWVFGNSVCGKMGDLPYLLFYLAGGVFAAWGYAFVNPTDFHLLGASGSIAAVTMAYLVLFPRSHVTVMVWLFIVYFFEVPAMLLIGLKIIVWDNMMAPAMGDMPNVAHFAHLAGYLFGFFAAVILLFVRALPRDQFDMLALWRQWGRRREMASAYGNRPYGSVGRAPSADREADAKHDRHVDAITELRSAIGDSLLQGDTSAAATAYLQLAALDERQCLAEGDQLEVARELYRTGRFAESAAAFERFAACHPQSRELGPVRLLLGIMYARELGDNTAAERHLVAAQARLEDVGRRAQCDQWLEQVRAPSSPNDAAH